jgi:hypothetical protein
MAPIFASQLPNFFFLASHLYRMRWTRVEQHWPWIEEKNFFGWGSRVGYILTYYSTFLQNSYEKIYCSHMDCSLDRKDFSKYPLGCLFFLSLNLLLDS